MYLQDNVRTRNDMVQEMSVVANSDMEIQARIKTFRGVQVMLDRDIAALYGVETKVLNQAVKRNAERFPNGFMFQLSDAEWTDLRSQVVTSNVSDDEDADSLRSQIVTSKRGGQRYRPYVFTEHGIVMLASVLKSDAAVQASVRIVNVFVAMRRVLSSLAPVLSRVETVERRLIGHEDAQKQTTGNVAIILDAMRDKKFPPQKVFFDGEFFDAFVQMKKFVRLAKKDLVVIDPYFDDTCLPLIAQKRPGVTVTVVRSAQPRLASKLHAADIVQFNRQFGGLTEKRTDKFHDRYLIIDNATLIHVGASLNHLGKRCFAFSTLDAEFIPDIMARVS